MLSDALLEQSIAIKGTVFRVRFGVWTPSAETHRPHRIRVVESLWLLRGSALATDVYRKQQPSLLGPLRSQIVTQETSPHPRWRARTRGALRRRDRAEGARALGRDARRLDECRHSPNWVPGRPAV